MVMFLGLLTLDLVALMQQKDISWLNQTLLQASGVQFLYVLGGWSLLDIIFLINSGFCNANLLGLSWCCRRPL